VIGGALRARHRTRRHDPLLDKSPIGDYLEVTEE
jgi:hypothetical protein